MFRKTLAKIAFCKIENLMLGFSALCDIFREEIGFSMFRVGCSFTGRNIQLKCTPSGFMNVFGSKKAFSIFKHFVFFSKTSETSTFAVAGLLDLRCVAILFATN